ncbi:ADP-ribosylglycohydrolase family protein [Planctomycetota bacterium]
MLGAIAGDIIGSTYEHLAYKRKEFPLFQERSRFTDDSVLTIAVADAILNSRSYVEAVHDLGNRYPNAGYGGRFRRWLYSPDPQPYDSWGNGSAMRVSPVGFAFDAEEEVLTEAEKSAAISHDHPEGIKGAQAAALAVFLSRQGVDKESLRARIAEQFEYDMDRTVDEIRPRYCFEVSCQETVPEAIIAFLDSESYEDAVRNAVSLGGDADTLACITGAIAEAFYGGVPEEIAEEALGFLPPDLREITDEFETKFHR